MQGPKMWSELLKIRCSADFVDRARNCRTCTYLFTQPDHENESLDSVVYYQRVNNNTAITDLPEISLVSSEFAKLLLALVQLIHGRTQKVRSARQPQSTVPAPELSSSSQWETNADSFQPFSSESKADGPKRCYSTKKDARTPMDSEKKEAPYSVCEYRRCHHLSVWFRRISFVPHVRQQARRMGFARKRNKKKQKGKIRTKSEQGMPANKSCEASGKWIVDESRQRKKLGANKGSDEKETPCEQGSGGKIEVYPRRPDLSADCFIYISPCIFAHCCCCCCSTP